MKTPWDEEQFMQLKAEHPDCVLLFRLGDFYEMFFDDAQWASKHLGLTLTTRNKSEPRVPLAGFPYYQLDAYTKKIVALGRRAAICEQT